MGEAILEGGAECTGEVVGEGEGEGEVGCIEGSDIVVREVGVVNRVVERLRQASDFEMECIFDEAYRSCLGGLLYDAAHQTSNQPLKATGGLLRTLSC